MGSDQQSSESRPGTPWRVVALAIFVALSGTVGILALTQGWVRPESIQETVRAAGAWGMVAYIAFVVVIELLWIPRAMGLAAGGVLFGPVVGGLLSIVADLIGATLCYALGRGGARAWVEGLLAKRPKAQRVVELLAQRRGIVTMAIMRIVPLAHYTVVSYAGGVAGVRFRHYILGTAIGLLPGAVVYPYVGHSVLRPGTSEFWIALAGLAAICVIGALLAKKFLKGD